MSTLSFDELEELTNRDGLVAAFDRLANELAAEGRRHELFDIRLMQARHRLGLNAASVASLDDLEEPARTRMEDAYLAACREVGFGLLRDGKLREAWMYLRPVGEKAEVAAELARFKDDAERMEPLIEIALHEGVSPELGFELVLNHYGICNAITMFDSQLGQRPMADRKRVAALLVRRLHEELLANVRAHVEQHEGAPAAGERLATLIEKRPWLFEADNYHVDTTHLASVVRIGMVCDDRASLELLADMCAYGRRLSQHYQFPGEEPFRDTYTAYSLFYGAQLGTDVDAAIDYFRAAAAVADAEENSAPAEILVGLLARLGRYAEALEESANRLPPAARRGGFAPTMVELADLGGLHQRLLRYGREREDLLSFAAALAGAAKK